MSIESRRLHSLAQQRYREYRRAATAFEMCEHDAACLLRECEEAKEAYWNSVNEYQNSLLRVPVSDLSKPSLKDRARVNSLMRTFVPHEM